MTVSHPPFNLVDGPFTAAVNGLLDGLDPGVKVLVFTSADPDFFLMHGDVEAILAIPPGRYTPASEPNAAAAAFERLHRAPVVSIGVIEGAARGGGAEFASALDLRYGSPRAVLGQPEAAMGILPGAGGTARLPRLLGRSRALDVILTGRDVAADEALALGWLDGVLAPADLHDQVQRVARRIAAMPAASIAAVKQVVDTSLGTFGPALVAETDAFLRLVSEGRQSVPMRRFLAAGGQTREGERDRMPEILEAMLDG